MKRLLLSAAMALTLSTVLALAETRDPAKRLYSASDLRKIVITSQTNALLFQRDYAGQAFGIAGPFRSATENPLWKGNFNIQFGFNDNGTKVYCWVDDPKVLAPIAEWKRGAIFEIRGKIKDTTMGDLELTECSFTPRQPTGRK